MEATPTTDQVASSTNQAASSTSLVAINPVDYSAPYSAAEDSLDIKVGTLSRLAITLAAFSVTGAPNYRATLV